MLWKFLEVSVEGGGAVRTEALLFTLRSHQVATVMACFLRELIAQVKRKHWLNSTHHSILFKAGEIRG